MSYEHTFDDYIKQLSFVRSSRYFPSVTPQVAVRPPPTPYECDYSFEAEYAARKAHESFTRAKNAAAAAPPAAPAPPPHRASPVEPRVSLPSTSHAILQPVRGTPVLQPSRPTDSGSSLPSVSSTSSLASSAASAAATVQPENFEDFEGGATTIFDEMHMKSIDDRSALNEIWGAVQVLPNSTVSFNAAAAAAAPMLKPRSTAVPVTAAPPAPAVPTRTAPVPPTLASASAAPPTLPARPAAPKPQTSVNGRTTPNGAIPSVKTTTAATSPPTLNDTRTAIGVKLKAKGFRSHVVQLALITLTQEQLPYIEYYIKATSNMEKVKLQADRGLAFLVDCKLTEKQDILRHAETVTQLSGMGFPIEKCMEASKEAKGDRVKALDICLAS